MTTCRLAKLTAFLVAGLVSMSAIANESWNGTIVVSDNYYPFGNSCNDNRRIKGVFCADSYCDNLTFSCGVPPNVWYSPDGSCTPQLAPDGRWLCKYNPTPSGDLSDYGPTTSSDHWWSTKAVCPGGKAMVGATSTGSYSASMTARCRNITGVPAGHWVGRDGSPGSSVSSPYNYWISEESSGNPQWTTDTFLAGMSCEGSNCDNNYFWHGRAY
jgi:hypothetical protein